MLDAVLPDVGGGIIDVGCSIIGCWGVLPDIEGIIGCRMRHYQMLEGVLPDIEGIIGCRMLYYRMLGVLPDLRLFLFLNIVSLRHGG